MTSQMVRRYRIPGELADDTQFVKTQENCRREAENQMRDEGFVPLYDLDPTFKTSYNPTRDTYEFVYTMQGVYIGKDKSWHFKGVINDRLVPKSTPTPPTK